VSGKKGRGDTEFREDLVLGLDDSRHQFGHMLVAMGPELA
jgi:hypothetical protein